MDYIQEYVFLLKERINTLEIQVATLRSMLPNPPPSNTPAPTPKPKHLQAVADLAKDLTLKS